MKVVIVNEPYGIDNIAIVERPRPGPPGPGQVLLRVTAGSLNYRDIMIGFGYEFKAPSGRIMGSDVTGVIEEVGDGVADYRIGDVVNPTYCPEFLDGPLTATKRGKGGWGGVRRDGLWAEYLLLDAEVLIPKPTSLTDIEAATLVCAGSTAWHALTWTGTLAPEQEYSDQILLVEGTGGVSIWGLQLATAAGVKVIVTSSSDAKLKRARELGAWETINYKTHPEWDVEVRRITGGRGVDHVFDQGGGTATVVPAIKSIAWSGTVSLCGGLSEQDKNLDMDLFNLMFRLQVVTTGSRQMIADLGRFVDTHQIRPEIARVFPFDQVKEALLYLKSQEAVGKVCLRF